MGCRLLQPILMQRRRMLVGRMRILIIALVMLMGRALGLDFTAIRGMGTMAAGMDMVIAAVMVSIAAVMDMVDIAVGLLLGVMWADMLAVADMAAVMLAVVASWAMAAVLPVDMAAAVAVDVSLDRVHFHPAH